MRHFKLFVVVAAVLMLALFSVQAGETEKEAVKEAVPTFKNQTNCPVMGGKIDSSVFTDIQGQRVYHCCPGCISALKKDPDKYFKKAAEEGIRYENIQTNCPVSGEELTEKAVSLDYEGRSIKLCCEGCREPFLMDAAKFLVAMDAPKKEKASDKKDMDMNMGGHEGHSHGDMPGSGGQK